MWLAHSAPSLTVFVSSNCHVAVGPSAVECALYAGCS